MEKRPYFYKIQILIVIIIHPMFKCYDCFMLFLIPLDDAKEKLLLSVTQRNITIYLLYLRKRARKKGLWMPNNCGKL